MTRKILVTAGGLVAGFLVGALATAVFVAGNVWDDRARGFVAAGDPSYPAEVRTGLANIPLLGFVVPGAAGAVNGAIGAWVGRRSGTRRLRPVAWLPLLILLLPVAEFLRHPVGWGLLVVVALFLAPFVWAAGRVGQRIGFAARRG
jgi:hypothetical protein